MYTRAEVAKMLGVNPKTVTQWSDEERLNPTRTLGGHRRFTQQNVDKLRSRRDREAAKRGKK